MRKITTTKVLVIMLLPFLLAISLISHAENYAAVENQSQDQRTVSGVVLDDTGAPLIGAVVQISGTNNGSITDTEGKYSIKNVPAGATLDFSYLGYKSQTVKTSGAITNVTMVIDALKTDEVVVVGFATQKKVNLTGSVSVVDEEAFEARPVLNVTQALQGVVPGLNISSTSGNLGETPKIELRGQGTIGEGSSGAPLILIDGMEGDINSLNPQDIAQVSVLKDAAASSIYGSRAPFGVILITTKSGKEGKMTVNYNNSFRFSTQTNMPDMPDSYSWACFYYDMQKNDGITPWSTDDHFDKILAYQKDNTLDPCKQVNVQWTGTIQGGNANNDWIDMIYKDWSFGQEHNLSLSGGTEKSQVYASVNYLKQGGFSFYAPDYYERISTNLRASGKISKYFRYNYNIKYQTTEHEEPETLSQFSPISATAVPLFPMYDPNGYIMDNWANAIQNGGTDRTNKNRLYQQFQVVATPLEGWNITGEVNYKYQSDRAHSDEQVYNFHLVDESIRQATTNPNSTVYERSAVQTFINPNIYTDYSKTFNDAHNLKVMVGFQSEKNIVNQFSAKQTGIIVSGSETIDMTDGIGSTGMPVAPSASGKIEDWATVGFFGRINYDYKNRYLLEINGRYDGTSRFRADKRWNFFPSFSAGWNIAQEEFMQDYSREVSVLKLRASYGELGNQNTTALYPTYQKLPTGVANGYNWLVGGVFPNTATAPSLISSSMTWETVKSTNIGLDVAAFRNRLTASFDWFNRRTTEMVGPAPTLPATLGTAVPKINNTDLTNRGWELSVRWNDRLKSGFGYGVGFSLADYQTTINNYNNPKELLEFKKSWKFNTYMNGGRSDTYTSGQKVGEIWGYTTIGIAKTDAEMQAHLATLPNGGQTAIDGGGDPKMWTAGDIMYADLNKDGKISSGANTISDPGDLAIIGNTTPRYMFGINLNADYKGFDFSAFFQGTMKRDYAMNSTMFFGATENVWNSVCFAEHIDYFRGNEDNRLGQNIDSYYPRPLSTKKNAQIQTKYLMDASYIRLKNVQLGYTFDNELISKIKLSNLRVFVSAENIWTATSLPDMFDPETIDGTNYGINYPVQATISFGINASF